MVTLAVSAGEVFGYGLLAVVVVWVVAMGFLIARCPTRGQKCQ